MHVEGASRDLFTSQIRAPASEGLLQPVSRSLLIDSNGRVVESAFIHFDERQLIVQADGDGGDTAQRTGMFYYAHYDPQAFERALNQLEVEPGLYVRHPRQGSFRNDVTRFSRDQQRPLVIALGKYGMYDRLWRLTIRHIFRLGKYQNMDFSGPSHIGEYIRAFRARALYPVLVVTDLALVFDTLEIAVRTRFNPDLTDDNNHLLSLLQAQDIMPTPTSWFARKLYLAVRPENLGNRVLSETSAVSGALAWYHRAENGGNPLIAEAYRDLIHAM
jgi:hypothetical protein